MNLTKLSEGFREMMYLDAAKYCTIGYGHLIKKLPCDGEPEEFAKGINEKKGHRILTADMVQARYAVSNLITIELNDSQYAALADFSFNIGSGYFQRSTLLKQVNQRQFQALPTQFRRWVKAGGKVFKGLQTRREREIALFFEGQPIPAAKSITAAELIDIRDGESSE
jgi:GH24 family phage-related lysozyme (muramidase)